MTWSAVPIGPSEERISELVANPLVPERIFAVGSTGDYMSVDGGQHFAALSRLPVTPLTKPQAFAIDPGPPPQVITEMSRLPAGRFAAFGVRWRTDDADWDAQNDLFDGSRR